MPCDAKLLDPFTVPPSAWDVLAPRGTLQHSHAYLRYRAFAEPGDYWLAGCWQGGALQAGAPFFLTTAQTAAFSDPWQLLTSPQFRRAPAGDAVASESLRAEHEQRLSAVAAGAVRPGELRDCLGEALVCRYFDQSGVLADQGLGGAARGSLVESIVRLAMDAVRAGQAGAVCFPYVLPADNVLRATLRELGFEAGIITAHSTTSLPAGIRGFDDYVTSLSKNSRRRFRGELESLRQAGITLTSIPLAGNEDAVAALEAQTQSRHGGPSAPAGIARMRRQMIEDFGDSVRIAAAFDGAKLVACGIDLLDEHNYYGLTYGCDYNHPNLSTCYMCIAYYDPIRFCLARGIGTLRYGFEAFEPKVLRGASLTPLELWIWTSDQKVNHALAELLAFIDGRSREYLSRWMAVQPGGPLQSGGRGEADAILADRHLGFGEPGPA